MKFEDFIFLVHLFLNHIHPFLCATLSEQGEVEIVLQSCVYTDSF